MTKPAKILTSEHRELHIMAEYVAVCWNLVEQTKTLHDDDGHTYQTNVLVRAGDVHGKVLHPPYIDVVQVQEDREGNLYLEHDSPLMGGMSAAVAEKIRDELTLAIEYLKGL